MKVSYSEFDVTLKGMKVKASCLTFQVHNYPQYRVVLNAKDRKPKIHIFYKIDDAHFFWFPKLDEKELEAKSIAKRLEELEGKKVSPTV